jgi:hypothetical protein
LIFIPNKPSAAKNKTSQTSLLKNKKFLKITATFFFHAWVQFSYRTLISLWIKTDKSLGGIDWADERKPGIMCCFSGCIVATLPFFINKRLNTLLGVGKSIMFCEAALIPFLIAIPFYNLLNEQALWVLLILTHGLILCFITISTSFISIGISNAVGDGSAGAGFGISQGIVSLSRSFSAAGSAEIYRKTIGGDFPFDSRFAFFIDSLVCVVVVIFVWITIGQSLDTKGFIHDTGDLESNRKEDKNLNQVSEKNNQ